MNTSLVKKVELQAQIPQENKPGVMSQLTRKTTINFQTKDKKRVFIARHFFHSYESLEVTSIFLYFIHMLPDMIKISSFGFYGNQYIL
jgi:hypothetical protein